jgi:hypothetical protein
VNRLQVQKKRGPDLEFAQVENKRSFTLETLTLRE